MTGPPEAVIADPRGRYWVLGSSLPPFVFDSLGHFERAVGGLGGGPGEFRFPFAAVLLPGDSVLVLDRGGPRAVVVGPDLRASRVIRSRWALGPAVVLDWPSAVVMSGVIGTPEGAGQPLHLVRLDGSEVAIDTSFGSRNETPGAPHRFEPPQRVTAGSRGRLWAAPATSYRVDQWTPDGRRTLSLERTPSWFSRQAGYAIGNPDTPPPSLISAIQEDPSGLLWVFVRVPAATWREAWRRVPEGAREVSLGQIDVEKLFATIIEVIDPRHARVVARARVEAWIVSALSGGRVASYGVDAGGEPRITISRWVIERD